MKAVTNKECCRKASGSRRAAEKTADETAEESAEGEMSDDK